MIIASCGTQLGMTNWQKQEFSARLAELGCTEFINGGCIGADEEAFIIALADGIDLFSFYPSTIRHKQNQFIQAIPNYGEWNDLALQGRTVKVRKYPERPALERNKEIVDKCFKLLATPKEHSMTLRSGTWATIRYAWKAKKSCLIIPPVDRED